MFNTLNLNNKYKFFANLNYYFKNRNKFHIIVIFSRDLKIRKLRISELDQ